MLGLQHNSEGEKFFAIGLFHHSIDDEKFSLRDVLEALEEGECVRINGLGKHLTLFYKLDGRTMFATQLIAGGEIPDGQEVNGENLILLERQFAEWMAIKQMSYTQYRVVFVYESL